MSTLAVKVGIQGASVNPTIRHLQTADGLRIACAEHGEGPPLVFVRAWISNIELMWSDPAFRSYFEALGRHFRVIRYDMRGNGLSDRNIPPITLEAMVSDLATVMDEFAAHEPAVLYGQCFGGPTAIAYAATHPERITHLVLDGTYADGRQITSQRRSERIVNTLRDQPEAGLLLLAHYTTPNQTRDRFRDTDEVGDSISPETAADLYDHGFKVDVREHLPRLTMPVLVMHRRDTRAVTMRLGTDLANAIAGARFVAIDGIPHNLWDEAPELALRALGEFLKVPIEPPGTAARASGLRTILCAEVVPESAGDPASLGQEHRAIVRAAADRHNGQTAPGGGTMTVAFTSAIAALDAARDIQRACLQHNMQGGDTLLVRIGVNAGEAASDDTTGSTAATARAIRGHAAGGEIVATNVVRELCAGGPFLFADRGTAQVEGFEEPVHVYEVKWTE